MSGNGHSVLLGTPTSAMVPPRRPQSGAFGEHLEDRLHRPVLATEDVAAAVGAVFQRGDVTARAAGAGHAVHRVRDEGPQPAAE